MRRKLKKEKKRKEKKRGEKALGKGERSNRAIIVTRVSACKAKYPISNTLALPLPETKKTQTVVCKSPRGSPTTTNRRSSVT